MSEKPLVLFTSFAPTLYGTERVILLTAQSLKDEFEPCIFSPVGTLPGEARRIGIESHAFTSKAHFARLMAGKFRGRKEAAVFTTSVWHSWVFSALATVMLRRSAHFSFTMGGTNERDAFSRKRFLNKLPLTFICPSDFIREKLAAHGADTSKIQVIPHYLTDSYASGIIPRPPFDRDGVRSVVVVWRIDPIKRIDILLDALDRAPDLADLPIRILGGGALLEEFQARAARSNPNVTFVGFTREVHKEVAASDLLLHLCPEEPGALSVIEALAARMPILVTDTGGVTSIIQDGQNGYYFRANDPDSLAQALRRLRLAPADELNRIAGNARASFEESYCEAKVVGRFRSLINAGLGR
jgi:glycosyltransferase involved in cell wall biosynthesis